ncbi:hypothetical protein CsSME_00021480 [Camellia sinensis var. sinensis]
MNILRPLSPHLPIYKPQLTSTFPISHRISGAFLATMVLFFYLLCLKIGLICFTYANFYQFLFYSSKLILISVEITALALSYHLYNGVRHLLTDSSDYRRIGIPFLCLASIVFLLYLESERVAFSLGSRALSFALRGVGCCCSAGLALTVAFALRAVLTGEGLTNMMAPSGGSGTSSWREDTREIDIFLESSWETEDTGSSVNQPVAPPVPPANPVASPGEEAGPSNPVRPEASSSSTGVGPRAEPSPPLPRVETPGIGREVIWGALEEEPRPGNAAPQENAPAEVHQGEELLRSIRAQIGELIRHRCERQPWRRGMSRFPEQDEVYAQGARNLMGDLEISSEMDADTLRSWNEAVKDPALLKSLIKDHFPD